MKKKLSLVFLALAIQLSSYIVCEAEEIGENMKKIIQAKMGVLERLAAHPSLVKSVKEHNSKKLDLKHIKAVDKEWKAGGQVKFVSDLLENGVSRFLRKKVLSNKLIFTEAFFCGNQGAIVGMYPKTSDYWQGDETKFIASFNDGNGKMFIGPVEFDESTQTVAVQISIPVKEQEKTIGVLVVGLRNVK